MGYFDYIAKQSFKSAPSGKRLFYRGGPWSRPYLVPDQATEQRLYIRQLWLMRLLLGVLILGQPFLFLLVPEVIREPLWFLGYLIAVTVVSGVAGHLLFRGGQSVSGGNRCQFVISPGGQSVSAIGVSSSFPRGVSAIGVSSSFPRGGQSVSEGNRCQFVISPK